MSSVRAQVAAQVRADNPKFDVAAFGRPAPDNLGAGKVRLSVIREELAAGSVANTLTHKLRLELLIGGALSEAAEDKLDEALDGVLLSLQRLDGVRFGSATRTVFDDRFIGFTITAEADSTNVYRSIVLQERA